MARRSLPDAAETAEILGTLRTRPIHRPPPPANRSVAALLKPLEMRFGAGPHALTARWREIVGDTLARYTEPVKLGKRRGTSPVSLEIRVDGPAAALIQHQSPDIIARVNLVLGDGYVDKLRIIQGPVRKTPAKPPPRRPPPLDAAREAELAQDLAKIEDGPLKSALERLGRGVLRAEQERSHR